MIKTTIVGFGDSLTCGYGVSPNINFIDRLERYMPLYFPKISWMIHNSGISSNTTREALIHLDKEVLLHHPNIVFILFGTNDAAMNKTQFRSLDEFEENLRQLIQRIKGHNNRTGLNGCIPIPVCITPPPINEVLWAPERTNNRIHQYGHVVKLIASEYNCPLVDFYQSMMDHKDYLTLLADDGLHLNEAGYDLLYDIVFSELTRLINYEGVLKDRDVILD